MGTVSRGAQTRNQSAEPLPLFAWAPTSRPASSTAVPLAAQKLAQRFGLPPIRAQIIAELAGFNTMEHVHDLP